MPFAIDEEKFRKHTTFDVSQPANSATGIPVKSIPHLDFPRLLYKHPVEPFKTILHRNAKHEVVHEELVATEHIGLVVNDKAEMDKALKEGWVKEPYIAPALPSPDAGLYDRPKGK